MGAGQSAGWLVPGEQDRGTGLRRDAVALVLHQACRALAARHTGPHAAGLQVSKGHMLIEAGAGTGRATLIKHKSTVQGASHHCRQSGKQGRRGPPTLLQLYAPSSLACGYPPHLD